MREVDYQPSGQLDHVLSFKLSLNPPLEAKGFQIKLGEIVTKF